MFKFKSEKKRKSNKKNEEGSSVAENSIDTDPLGMWTGVPDDPYELPVQDVDDL